MRARQTGNLRLSGLHPDLRQVTIGPFPRPEEDPARPHAGKAQGDQGGTAATPASAPSRAGDMAEAGRDRLLCLPCGSDQPSALGSFRHHVANLWRRSLRRRSQRSRLTWDRMAVTAMAHDFLSAEHFRSEPDHYARNAIHIAFILLPARRHRGRKRTVRHTAPRSCRATGPAGWHPDQGVRAGASARQNRLTGPQRAEPLQCWPGYVGHIASTGVGAMPRSAKVNASARTTLSRCISSTWFRDMGQLVKGAIKATSAFQAKYGTGISNRLRSIRASTSCMSSL